jgi:hypothetical protein
MRQPTKADLSLIAALTGASLLVACNGSDDAPAAAAQPFANPTPVAQAYVAPPRLCAPATGDQPEPGVNGHIPKSAMFDAVTNPDGFQGYWCGVKQVAQHTLFGRGAFGDLQIKTSGASRCAYASNRDGALGSDAALTSGIIVFDVRTPSKMQVVPASGDTQVVGTAPSAILAATSTNKWGEETTAATPVNPNGQDPAHPGGARSVLGPRARRQHHGGRLQGPQVRGHL